MTTENERLRAAIERAIHDLRNAAILADYDRLDLASCAARMRTTAARLVVELEAPREGKEQAP